MRAAAFAASSAAASPAMRDRISAPSMSAMTASAVWSASASGQPSARSRSATAAHQPPNTRADAVPDLGAGVHRLGGDRFDGAAVALIGGQPGGHQVDPAVDDVGHRQSAVEKLPQPPLDGGADAVHDGGGQFLLAVGEVVIQRAGLDSAASRIWLTPVAA